MVLMGLLLVLGFLYLHRQDLGLIGPRTSATGEDDGAGAAATSARPARVDWRTIDRSSEGFKVDMPGEIKETQIPAYNNSGGAVQVEMIYANPDSQTTYSVSWADNPPVAQGSDHTPDKVLDMARDNALARTQTLLLSESKSALEGYPSRDFASHNSGGGVMNVRLIYAAPRLYMLIAAFPSANARQDRDVTRFLSSFAISSRSQIPETVPPAPAPVRRDLP